MENGNGKWKTELRPLLGNQSNCAASLLFPVIHMPTRIHPLPFAQHEYLGDPAGLLVALAACLQLVRIVRVDHGG